MVVFHLLETSPMVRNVRFLDIICRKGVPCTKKKSAQRETSRWRFLMEISIGIWVYVGIIDVLVEDCDIYCIDQRFRFDWFRYNRGCEVVKNWV